jgi:multidrug efflux pump subunit AcrA (membrane-fusion protein)
VTGHFAVAPALSLPLTAPDSGLVARVYVREGTRVEAGMPLLQVRDLDLERAALAAARRVDSLEARETQARAADRNTEVARLAAERATEAARLQGMTVEQHALTCAPSPGRWSRRAGGADGQWVSSAAADRAGPADSLEIRIALAGAGATQVREGQPVGLVFHADAGTLAARVTGVAQVSAAGSGAVEARVGMRGSPRWRPGMTGEASITLRRSNLWGSLWWGVRRGCARTFCCSPGSVREAAAQCPATTCAAEALLQPLGVLLQGPGHSARHADAGPPGVRGAV